MHQYIKLEFAGLTFTIDGVVYPFLNSEFPRSAYEIPDVQRSAYGTYYSFGHVYEDDSKWRIATFVNEVDQVTIDAMFFQQSSLQRTQQNINNKILLTDTTKRTTERSPRTRAKAPSPFDDIISVGTSPIFLGYYPKFYVRFSKAPVYTKKEMRVRVELEFREWDSKVPTSMDG